MNNAVDRMSACLKAAFQPSYLHIEDESWKHAGHAGVQEHGGGHFVLRIASEQFDSLTRMQVHRMIFKALHDFFPATIHALSIQLVDAETSQ